MKNWKVISLVFIFIFFFTFFTVGIFYIWFNRPNDESVKKEFLSKNPTFEVTSLYVGEGNSDFAEYHIEYKKPNDKRVYDHIITYWNCDNNNWKISCNP